MSKLSNKLFAWRSKLRTYRALGITNIFSVAVYRLSKKHGLYTRVTPAGDVPTGPFFQQVSDSEQLKETDLTYFSHHHFNVKTTPAWFSNPFNGAQLNQDNRHWSAIPDNYSTEIGDIKVIWEPSRFDWLPKLAWQYQYEHDPSALPTLESWFRDWVVANPVNCGWNWKCGQETSFRAMNALLAAKILDAPFQHPSDGLLNFYESHIQRVLPTLRYAMAQDNNHGTSEAACLYIVGAYLQLNGNDAQAKLGAHSSDTGRRWLENRIHKLIMPDGSFSQHSLTYHRLMLDTLSYTELFRIELDLPKLSDHFYAKAATATQWLSDLINFTNGDGPNLGSNDGAYLFNCNEQPYRDFRPTADLALSLFRQKRLAETQWHSLSRIFNVQQTPLTVYAQRASTLFPDGGYCLLRSGTFCALMRLPVYRFRPAQSDAHHLDVWFNGLNIIRDAGSYCYNSGDEQIADFYLGSRSHSTARFDDRNQMPKVSHFLIGEWLKPDLTDFNGTTNSIKSRYVDAWGASHERSVQVSDSTVAVVDTLDGFKDKAEIRWRLAPLEWTLDGQSLTTQGVQLKISAPEDATYRLVEEYESAHYLQQQLIPVLIITVKKQCQIETTISVDEQGLTNQTLTN